MDNQIITEMRISEDTHPAAQTLYNALMFGPKIKLATPCIPNNFNFPFDIYF